jgi:hypothetical protein
MLRMLGLVLLAVATWALPAHARDQWELLGTQSVGFVNDRDVIKVGRDAGRYRAVQLRVSGNEIELLDFRVVYSNGTVDDYPANERIPAGGQTRPFELKGRGASLDRIELRYRSKPSFRGFARVEVWGLEARGSGRPAAPVATRPAPLPPPPKASWASDRRFVMLGEQTVGFLIDRDVIRIGQSEDWYRTEGPFRGLRLTVHHNDIYLQSLRITYMNGFAEDVRVDRAVRNGDYYDVDLRGERSYLREIALVYRSRPDFRGQALVRIFGTRADQQARPPARPPVRPGPGIGFTGAPSGNWEMLGSQRVGFRQDRDVITVGLREGSFRTILLRVRENDVEFNRVTVVFGNNTKQDLDIRRVIRDGGHSGRLDLEGEARFIKEIRLSYRARDRFDGRASVEVWGERAAGRGGAFNRSLVLLGQSNVGTRTEREVIRVDYGEDWYRDQKPFRALQIAVDRNDLHLLGVRIIYMNGHREELREDRTIRAGQHYSLDLRGDRRYLREIELLYRARGDGDDRGRGRGRGRDRDEDEALVRVYGQTADYREGRRR